MPYKNLVRVVAILGILGILGAAVLPALL